MKKNIRLISMLAGAAVLAAVVTAYWLGAVRADGIPSTNALHYVGTLEESGVPVDGDRTIGISLFDTDTGGAALCSGMDTVTVTAGRFSVALPDACTDTVRDYPDVWIEVWVEDDTRPFPREKLGAVPYAVVAANGVPVGGVMWWYRPDPTFSVPTGFQICDGSPITDGHMAGMGWNTPNLIGRFIKGVDGAGIGDEEIGGTSSNGDHTHRWAHFNGSARSWSTETATIIDWSDGIDNSGSGHYPIAVTGSTHRDYYTWGAGAHTHPTAVPANVGLLPLMRIY